VGRLDVPFLAGGSLFGWDTPDFFGWLQRQRWFLLSDLGGLFRGLTGNLHLLTLLAVLVVPLTWWLLWRTPFGLRLRSVGENPFAADSLGVAVYRMKYVGTAVSGGLAGFGGAYLVLVSTGNYREGQTNGRGFIGLAALIFGNWRPTGVGLGSGLFGFATAVQLRSNEAVHGLLLFVALASVAFAAWSLWRRRAVPAVLLTVTGLAFWFWYLSSDSVPTQFISFTPHVTTLLVLALAAQRLRPPAAEGKAWRKGQTE
jgi:simple sugar transport system permease protein